MSKKNRKRYARNVSAILPACISLSVALGAGLGLARPALAEMYRWVDENGGTVYSQHPPPDTPATTIAPPPKPSTEETARAFERLKDQIIHDFDAKEAKRKEAADQAKAAQEQAIRDSNCAAARSNLEAIRNLGARRLQTPDGEFRRLSDAERADGIQKMQQMIDENCN